MSNSIKKPLMMTCDLIMNDPLIPSCFNPARKNPLGRNRIEATNFYPEA